MRGLVVAAAITILTTHGSAGADIGAHTGGLTLPETQHEVVATVDGDLVTFRVRRTIKNVGELVEEALLMATLPAGGAVKGMRVHANGAWSTGMLLPSKSAFDRYQSERPAPGALEQHPALMTWAGTGHVSTRVHPIAPGESVTVEYTVIAPTERENGRYRFSYPRPGAGMLPPTITVVGPSARGQVWIDGQLTRGHERTPLSSPLTRGERIAGSLVELPITAPETAGKSGQPIHVRVFFTHPDRSQLKLVVINPAGRMQTIELKEDAEPGEPFELAPEMLFGRRGVWRLAVSDLTREKHGTLHSWRLGLGGKELRSARSLRIPDAVVDGEPDWEDVWQIEVDADPGRIDSTFSLAPIDSKRSMARLHIDLPDALSSIPDDLRVVFLLDTSRSRSTKEISESLDIAAAVLRHAPAAQFEIVRFDRRAAPLLGRFASAAEFGDVRARLTRAGKFRRANGSHLDVGLDVAVRALARTRGTPRIIMLGDGRNRSLFSLRTVSARLKRASKRLVAHGVEPSYSSERDDAHPLAALAKVTGGIAMRVQVGDVKPDQLTKDVLELVRPVRVDNLQLGGGSIIGAFLPDEIAEGDGIRIAGITTTALTVRGELWSRPVSLSTRSVDGGVLAAALTFGDNKLVRMVAGHVPALAMLGHVVSEATSFLSVRPGTRPISGIGFGYLSGSGGSRCGGAFGIISPAPSTPVSADDLAGPLAVCAARVQTTRPSAHVTLETTGAEIVDVHVRAPSSAFARCLEDEVWKLELSRPDGHPELEVHSVELSALPPAVGSRSP